MKIVLIGTVRFSERMLQKLIAIGADVVGVITAPNSGFNADYAELSRVCAGLGIDCHVTKDANDSTTLEWLGNKHADVVFCLGWSSLLKEELLALPRLGVVGFHPAALPKNRGRHPLIWALVLGLNETASTFFMMDKGADSGDILSQVKIEIDPDDDAQSLYSKVEQEAEQQLVTLVDDFQRATYTRKPQDESQASYWRKRSRKDGVIDWRMSARSIHNLVRGLSRPYCGAEFEQGGESYSVWRSRVVNIDNSHDIEPGKVVDVNEQGNTIVRCGEGCLELIEVEPSLALEKGSYL